MTTGDRLLFTPADASEMLGLGKTKVYELMASGELHSVKIGRCRRIPARALYAFLSAIEQEAA
ncbi:helix-turn-helix domain-containing protein [Sphaerisporangium sp. TRM90804]|uniref:helix-turn-helix domain-containing protein n=1 Tax=Sphaerisporangium sp. TRM90804 TaxID=3031113 RepID=UPI00244BADCC|nr:helix-turn-helix domain-containing protein [Sphaerisporangium sp. TRM90804]MDH2429288.1 helix-turn-helix domain-containing protein [Sphaerisporangium sp. TRM90804]